MIIHGSHGDIHTPPLRVPSASLSRWLLWIGLLMAGLAPAWAHAESLAASVSRDRLYANEAFTLTLRAETELKFHLGSLLDPRDLEIPLPDLEPLKDAFRILDRNQQMSIQSQNGQHDGTVIWTFLMIPKRTGTLTIPSLSFRNLTSDPISIEVLPGVAPPEEDHPDAQLEVTLSENDVYVQQQVLLTQRVYYDPPIRRGNLSAPEIPDATVRAVSDQREFRARRNDREWQVVERRFAVVPQSPGRLTIPEQTFTARKRNDDGDMVFIHASAPPLELIARPPPESFTGDVWLPARNLELDEEWSDPPSALKAGDSITRTVHVRALGVAPESLPRIDIGYPDSLREYPEPWRAESRLTENSVEARIQKQSALVPIRPGETEIPPIRVPWWDVEADQQRIAEIAGSRVHIEPATSAQRRNEGDGLDGKSDTSLSDISLARSSGASLPPLWFWLALVLASGWLITGIAWWRNRRSQPKGAWDTGSVAEKANRERFQSLCEYAQRGSADTLTLLPQWASAHFNKPALTTVGDVTAYLNDPRLTREIQALERHLFANPTERDPWQGDELVFALRRIAGKPKPVS